MERYDDPLLVTSVLNQIDWLDGQKGDGYAFVDKKIRFQY